MFEVRKDEPGYAFIPDVETAEKNQWGTNIATVAEDDAARGKSLNINGDQGISENPNRYKQHGFHFTADNCIGCHACEAACSEKNDLPAHLSFRSVGYIEGGSYPAYQRLNISMACNHCDDPVCLKGCPTRAYSKYAEYGAVLQDPDTCFGCGYCTWVCPYNAPQLDLSKGEVSKCNMCVDRLEVGLKPACAAACLGGALDFGVIETKPENREQAKVQIPGFPDPAITNPNIRFQQTRSLPREMTRTDSQPLRYQRDEQGQGEYKSKPVIKPKHKNGNKEWNFSKLSSRENPLVIFTLISQAVVGAFSILYLAPLLGITELSSASNPKTVLSLLVFMFTIQVVGLAMSTLHLGKPHRFYRAFNNLKYSPVGREVASLAVFFSLFSVYVVLESGLLSFLPATVVSTASNIVGLLALVMGPIFIYAMHKIYRIKARPFWNHWQVLTTFFGNTLALGALLVAVAFSLSLALQAESFGPVISLLAPILFIGLLIEGYGLYQHKKDLEKSGGEGAAAQLVQESTFGKTYQARNMALISAIILVGILSITAIDGYIGVFAWLALSAFIIATAVIGRALFYVLVIPTTMPGAFFWKNAGFQDHARESGLADMQQVGVLPKTDYHHELMARAKNDIAEEINKIKQEGFIKGISSRLVKRIVTIKQGL